MTQKEILYNLLTDIKSPAWFIDNAQVEKTVDYLLGNGVIVTPVKIEQTVYVINKTDIRGYKVNTIVVGDAYHKCYFFAEWYYDSLAFHRTDFDFADVGKTVFLSREEAEKALAERQAENDKL